MFKLFSRHNEHLVERQAISDTFTIECAVMKLRHYYNCNEIERILNAIRHNDQTIVTSDTFYKVVNGRYKKV